jgi:Leucine-rich repeat (LRR) protein
MKPLRVVNVLVLLTLLAGGLMALPTPARGQSSYDCSTATGMPQAECEALVALYEATDGDHWDNNSDWLQTTTPCVWYGVTCSNDRVSTLSLRSNNLSGVLPSEIGNLTALTYLWLWDNQLTILPPEIGNLTALRWLHLSDNQLTTLPPEIGNLTALQMLNLYDNQLTTLPPEIGNLTALGDLGLSGNQLTTLPPEIGNLTALRYLRLGYNQLTTLPSEIGNLTWLEQFELYGNQLTTLPPEIGNLTALTDLHLGGNQLTTLPPEIGNLTALTDLHLWYNQLTTLPPEIGNLTALERLDLDDNQLTTLPSEIGNLTALTSLGLSYNQLTTLPPEIGNLTALEWLVLYDNQLTTLPPEIGNLTGLGWLWLHNNPLKGNIPTDLTTLTSLNEFTFYDTQWCVPATGDVPLWLAGIDEVYGTGRICEQPPGSLQGTVTAPDSSPATGIHVNIYRPTSWPRWSYVTTTHTLADGSYRVDGLGQGIDYRVEFVDPAHTYAPEYYDDQPTLNQSTPVTVTLGETRTGIDAALAPPQPPAATVEAGSGSVMTNPKDGTVMINMVSSNTGAITVTRSVTCASGSPTSVTLTLEPPGQTYLMTAVGGDQYQATVPGTDITQDGSLVVAATCGVTETETTVGHVNLYDPSGTISDAVTGGPVDGATVTLYQVPDWEPKTGPDDDRPNTCQSNLSKDPGDPWNQPAPTDLGVIVNPEVTTVDPSLAYQQTEDGGHYGWDVGEGCWYVQVTAEGYEPLTSPVVGVPPEVTDLHLALTPSSPAVTASVVKSATPALTVTNGSAITYTLVVSASADTTLHLYDRLDPKLMWEGFVGDAPGTLIYTTALTGTVTLSATTPLTVSFVVTVDLPPQSFVNEYAQVDNTAYYYFLDETLVQKHPSNTVTRVIYDRAAFDLFLPLVLKESP